MERKFIPKNGSLYTPFSTSTANTVFGEEVLYQLEGSKLAVETASPPALTFAEDSTAHPSRSMISPSPRETGAAIVAAARRIATKLEAAKKLGMGKTTLYRKIREYHLEDFGIRM